MSTRAVIGRSTGDSWEGRYHHSDGYPSGLGQFLWHEWHERYHGDTARMLKLLVDDHPAGWSCIIGTDLDKQPGYREFPRGGDIATFAEWEASGGPRCYCHGDRHEQLDDLIRFTGDTWGTEYAYIFGEDGHSLSLFARSNGRWAYCATWDYNGPEPAWRDLDARY